MHLLFISNTYPVSLIFFLASCFAFVVASPVASEADVYATATTTLPGAQPTFTITARRRTHNYNQNSDLKKIEAQAWADAGTMSEIAYQYDNGNEWQPAMDYWMGSDSVQAENFYKILGESFPAAFMTVRHWSYRKHD